MVYFIKLIYIYFIKLHHYYLQSMQQNRLLTAFVNWTTQLVNDQPQFDTLTQSQFFINKIKKLLHFIDDHHFGILISNRFSLGYIEESISEYYQQKFDVSKTLVLSRNTKGNSLREIQYIFKMSFELGLKIDRILFIEHILDLSQQDQQILQPFIMEVIQGIQNDTQNKDFLVKLEHKQSEIIDLKKKNLELKKMINELEENYYQLKQQKIKLEQDLHIIKNEKLEILSQLAITHQDDYVQHIKIFKQNYNEVIDQIQKLKQNQIQLNYQNQYLRDIVRMKDLQITKKGSELELFNDTIHSLGQVQDKSHLDQSKKQIQQLKSQIKQKDRELERLRKSNNKKKLKLQKFDAENKRLMQIFQNFKSIKQLNERLSKTIQMQL